jgi:hypothetical protein
MGNLCGAHWDPRRNRLWTPKATAMTTDLQSFTIDLPSASSPPPVLFELDLDNVVESFIEVWISETERRSWVLFEVCDSGRPSPLDNFPQLRK